MFKGIDLSYEQPTIDWDILKLQGIDFCYIKVAEGIHTVDSMCKNHAINAKKYSYLCGYYYFAHPARCNAKESADFFKSNLADLPPADMLFALDIEVNGEQGYTPLSAADLEKWISDFINELGLPVIIYGGPGFLDANLPADHHLGQYPLWLSEYEGTAAPTQYPRGWSACSIWQYTGKGTIKGIAEPVDLNVSQALPMLPAA